MGLMISRNRGYNKAVVAQNPEVLFTSATLEPPVYNYVCNHTVYYTLHMRGQPRLLPWPTKYDSTLKSSKCSNIKPRMIWRCTLVSSRVTIGNFCHDSYGIFPLARLLSSAKWEGLTSELSDQRARNLNSSVVYQWRCLGSFLMLPFGFRWLGTPVACWGNQELRKQKLVSSQKQEREKVRKATPTRTRTV